jgi:hypothetical protein
MGLWAFDSVVKCDVVRGLGSRKMKMRSFVLTGVGSGEPVVKGKTRKAPPFTCTYNITQCNGNSMKLLCLL